MYLKGSGFGQTGSFRFGSSLCLQPLQSTQLLLTASDSVREMARGLSILRDCFQNETDNNLYRHRQKRCVYFIFDDY